MAMFDSPTTSPAPRSTPAATKKHPFYREPKPPVGKKPAESAGERGAKSWASMGKKPASAAGAAAARGVATTGRQAPSRAQDQRKRGGASGGGRYPSVESPAQKVAADRASELRATRGAAAGAARGVATTGRTAAEHAAGAQKRAASKKRLDASPGGADAFRRKMGDKQAEAGRGRDEMRGQLDQERGQLDQRGFNEMRRQEDVRRQAPPDTAGLMVDQPAPPPMQTGAQPAP